VSDQVDPAASDVSEQPETETTVTEQPTTESKSFGSDLMQIAAEMGHDLGDTPPPKAEAPPEPEPEPEVEEEPSETEETKTEEEVKPEATKGDKLVPLREVLAEREKKKRANERAEQAEAHAAALQAQLHQAVAPTPTEDDPFKDINDFAALDRLERSYEKAVDLADENPEGAVEVVVGRDANGQPIKRDFAPEELVSMRKKADKAIR
jgi:outer membrane biosynthesis protein TonB